MVKPNPEILTLQPGVLDDDLKRDIEELLGILDFLEKTSRPHSSACLHRFSHQIREHSFQQRLITAKPEERREINARQIHSRAYVLAAVLEHFAQVSAFNGQVEKLGPLIEKILARRDEIDKTIRSYIVAKCMQGAAFHIENRKLDNPGDSLRFLNTLAGCSSVHMFESLRLIFAKEVPYSSWPYPLKFILLRGGTEANQDLSDAFAELLSTKALLEASFAETKSHFNRPHVFGVSGKLQRSILENDQKAFEEARADISSANLRANHDLHLLSQRLADTEAARDALSKLKDTVDLRFASLYTRPSSLVGYGNQACHAIDMLNCIMAEKELKEVKATIAEAQRLIDRIPRIFSFDVVSYLKQ